MIKSTFGHILNTSFNEIMSDTVDVSALLYDGKILIIKGLGELSVDQLYDVNAKFGTPWSVDDHQSIIAEKFRETASGERVPYFDSRKYGLLATELPWHRDIPWHFEAKYPIRTLYAHDTYATPTQFVDCDVLLDSPFAELLDDLEMLLQYWYDRQHDHDHGKICRYLTKYVPLVETNFFGRKSVVLNSFGLYGVNKPVVKWQTGFRGAWFNGCRRKSTGEVYTDEKFLELMSNMHEFVAKPEDIYSHQWEKNDLVLFDNMSGVFHARSIIDATETKRTFDRINIRHFWQTKPNIWPEELGPIHMHGGPGPGGDQTPMII